MTTRKITYHILKFIKKQTNDVIFEDFDFSKFCSWFNNLKDEDKIYNISDNKFTSLDLLQSVNKKSISTHQSAFFGMMSTGNHGSRRNLKNSVSNTRRENPKKIEEGEEQENYFIIGFNNKGNADLILQNAGRGIKSVNLKNYLDKFINIYLSENSQNKEFKLIEGTVVSSPDKMIDRLDRITTTKIYIDKSILNKSELDLTERTLQAKQELIIDVRAQRGQDIRDLLQDVRQNVIYNNKIDKIWVKGKDNLGNESSFYLNKIQKATFVSIDINPSTASLVRQEIKSALIKLL